MSKTIELLRKTVLEMLEETFERVHGYYLDRGTSLFETLETITAEEASRPVSATCTSIAGHVEHVRFYLNVVLASFQGKDLGKIDWEDSWHLRTVTPDEWEDLKARLRALHQEILTTIRDLDTWEGENDISDSLAVIVHTAYHLGEIRQSLCVIH